MVSTAFMGDGGQLGQADDLQHLGQQHLVQAAEDQHPLGHGLDVRGVLQGLALAVGQLGQGQVILVRVDHAHPQAEHGEDLPQLRILRAGALVHQNGSRLKLHVLHV